MRWLYLNALALIAVVSLAPSAVTFADPMASAALSPAAASTAWAQGNGSAYTLPPVVVSATRTDITPANSTSYLATFTNEDVKQTPALMVDDALRFIPGFNTFRRSSSMVTAPADDPEAQGVTLRGVGPGGASRALVLLDGIPQTDAFGGWIYWDELPLAGIDRVEVVEGGGSDLWGSGAEGGVINIISKPPANVNNVQVEGSYGNRNTTQDNISGDYLWGPAKITLEQDFFNTNGWDIVKSGFRGPIDHSSSSMHTLSSGRIELDPGNGIMTFLRGSFYQEYRDLGTAFQSSATTRGFVNAGGSYDDHNGDLFNASVYAHLTTYHQNFSMSDMAQTMDFPAQTQRVPSTDVGGFFTWTRTFFQHHTIAAGGDFRLIDGTDYDNFYNTTGSAIDLRRESSGNQQFGGAYIEDLFRPFEQLEIDASVRGDIFTNNDGKIVNTPLTPDCTVDGLPCGPASTQHFSNQMRTATSPRLGVRYDMFKWLEFRGSLYEAYRAPTLAELYRQSSVEDLVLVPNPNLKPEFLYGADGGFVLKPIPGLTASWTGFWNNLFNPINNVVTASFPDGSDAQRTRENLGRARIRGYEAEAEYDFPWINWFEWSAFHPKLSLTANYLRSEATLTSSPPDPTLVGRRLALVPWDTLSIGLRYSDSMLGEVWVQEQYQGKQWEDSDNHDLQPAYWVTNMTWSRALPHFSNASWVGASTAYVKVQNMFNNQYIIDLGGDIPKIGTPIMVVGGLRVPLDF
jgi:outer membrane receptor protein involved in Fe transport